MPFNTSKNYLAIALCTAVVILVSCASESRGPGSQQGSGSAVCPSVGNLTVESVLPLGGSLVCIISGGPLTQNATLASGTSWEISGAIEVSGNSTLTVSPGAQITAANAGTSLYVSTGSTLNAQGTADRPIVFSSTDDGEEGAGEWGGIIVESFAASTTAHRLRYVVVAEAGATIDAFSGIGDFNASLVLLGEHQDTRVSFFQSHDSGSDGIRIVSEGSINTALLENILITSAVQDAIDFDNLT